MTVDWVIRSGSAAKREIIANQFIWFDIDDKTYDAWQAPLYTPRSKVKRLISYATESGAELVIVDIDLTQRRQCENSCLSSKSNLEAGGGLPSVEDAIAESGDQQLYDYVASYPANCNRAGSCPPIILLRSFHNGVPQPSFLDPAILHATRIFWASAQFEPDEDMMIRRWRLWESRCENGHAEVVPSIELLATALIDPDQPQVLAEDPSAANNFLGQLLESSTSCLGNPPRLPSVIPSETHNRAFTRRIVEHELKSHSDRFVRRIVYSVSWRPGDTTIARPAMDLVDAPVTSHSAFNGKIVVIGGSFRDSGDIHPTPLGPMPGTLALINSVTSLELHGGIARVQSGLDLIFEILLIILMSLIFLARSFIAMLLSTAVILGIVVPICLQLFANGVWLDFAIPLLAVQVHELVARVEEMFD